MRSPATEPRQDYAGELRRAMRARERAFRRRVIATKATILVPAFAGCARLGYAAAVEFAHGTSGLESWQTIAAVSLAFAGVAFVLAATVHYMGEHVAQTLRERAPAHLLAKGATARARVLSWHLSSFEDAEGGEHDVCVDMLVEVQPTDRPPYQAYLETWREYDQTFVKRLEARAGIRVRYDRRRPARVALEAVD